MVKNIAHIAVSAPVEGHFDYQVPLEYRQDIALGMRVLVSFSRRKCVGMVIGFAEKSAIPKLNNILALLDEDPVFSENFLKFAEVFSLRFGCSCGEALAQFLPSYLRGPKKFVADGPAQHVLARPKGNLSLLLDYGRQKRWDILIPRIKATLDSAKAVIVIVPDASYSADVVSRLEAGTGVSPSVLSEGTDKEEFICWAGLRCGKKNLAVGFISAVLAPARQPGLIVVLDEESPSFKNDQSPFYEVREAALLRCAIEGTDVLFVSSAPSPELWKLVSDGKVSLESCKDDLAPVKFLDLTNFKMRKGTFMSQPLRQHLEAVLKEGGKVLLFIQASRGTEAAFEEARSYFPFACLGRYDKTSSGAPDFDILIATQAVFRYRDKVRFDMSVVLDIDWEFHKADYRAAHGAFALTRYLRQITKKAVFLQTRHMDQPLLHSLAEDDPAQFYDRELAQRKEMGLSPYAYMVAIVLRSTDAQLACGEAKALYDKLNSERTDNVDILEPEPDRSAVARGKFRYCVMVRGASLKAVMGLVKAVQRSFRRKKDIVLTVNVNP